VAAAGLNERVSLVRADGCRTGLPPQSFNVVTSNSILHHVRDPNAFWEECKRLARPGALLFHRDLMRPDCEDAVRRIVDRHAGGESPLLREEFHRSLLSAYEPDEIRAQLDRAGLGMLTVEAVTDRHVDFYGRFRIA
jgi:SAM-dependent methyltransferase